jgi:hypothetical protein
MAMTITARFVRSIRTPRAWRATLAVGFALAIGVPATAFAQAANATLVGTVVDATGAVVADAGVVAVNLATSVQRRATSTKDGAFVFTALPPGRYTVRATIAGFLPAELQDVVLNVNDRVSVRIELELAARGEGVTVTAQTQRLSTAPSVSTVVDRQFVENLPLNGRSLQSLLELTPGVVLTQVTDGEQQGGQFSVNGQRTNANYFTVDGVSANVGISAGSGSFPGQSGSGQLPAMTALGGTNGLVSVDALQEFRIQTSTYAPEFGRTPGGQISMVTRSGTNMLHGSMFEYFRDDALDANDWFAKRNGLAKPQLEQHNFGGVLGGPILRDRTFFFGSYEGLRLKQPIAKVVSVPTLDVRRNAVPEAQPYLNALPIPNGKDLGGGFAEFAASYSDPAQLDSTSIRLDHNATGSLTFFGRVSHAPSYSTTRAGTLSYTNTTNQNNTSVTIGSTWVASARMVHDLRMNFTTNDAPYYQQPDDFGGAVPPPASVFEPGLTPDNGRYVFQVLGGGEWLWGIGTAFEQRQFNIVDSLTLTTAAHEIKFGLDFRRLNPLLSGGNIGFQGLRFGIADLPLGRANRYQTFVRAPGTRAAAFDNLSLFVQDNWRPSARLTFTYGLRWEFVPPPHATEGGNAVTLDNIDNPYGGQVHLAPSDTALWKTRYDNFAPRVGASYVLSDTPGAQLVIKGGFGMFHDMGFGQVATAYRTYPFAADRITSNPRFPLTPEVMAHARLIEDPPQQIYMMDRNLEMPFTYQWNVSVERSFGASQTVTAGYIGADGHRLLKLDRYNVSLQEWPTVRTPISVNRNRGYSDYQALQLQFQRRLHQGLQSLVSYTFGRSRDTTSSDAAINIPAEKLPPALDYGYSDFDVRHVFTMALTYQTPAFGGSSLWRAAASDWGLDLMLRARTAFPINVTTTVPFPPDNQSARPNVVSGQPFWIDDANVPGGQRLNRQAFTTPAAETQGNLERGTVRGFDARQVDFAIRRDVGVWGRARLQFRFEMFNLFNTPNFIDPTGSMSSADFGVSTQMLGRGFGGLSSLYQIGGPRSSQAAVKLLF